MLSTLWVIRQTFSVGSGPLFPQTTMRVLDFEDRTLTPPQWKIFSGASALTSYSIWFFCLLLLFNTCKMLHISWASFAVISVTLFSISSQLKARVEGANERSHCVHTVMAAVSQPFSMFIHIYRKRYTAAMSSELKLRFICKL